MRRLVLAVLASLPLASRAQAPPAAPAGPPPAPTAPAIEPAAPPAATVAAPEARRSTAFARVGVLVPRHDDLQGFEDGPAIEAGLRTRVWRWVDVEVAAGWLRTSRDRSGSSTELGAYDYTDDLTAVPLLASVRASARWGSLEPYVLAGGGLYLWSMREEVTSSEVGKYSFSDTATTLAGHVGAGLTALVSRRVTLALDARYLFGEATLLGATRRIDSAIVSVGVGYGF